MQQEESLGQTCWLLPQLPTRHLGKADSSARGKPDQLSGVGKIQRTVGYILSILQHFAMHV